MNRFFKLFAAAAIVASAAGCTPQDPEDDQQGNTPTTDVLSAPELTATASEGSISFTWTSGTIENSKLDVDYTLYVGKAGSDLFDAGVPFETEGLSHKIEGDEYTNLLNDMGCQSGGTVDMIAIVTATAGNETKTSAQKAFTAGLPAAEVVFPEALYMKGGACPGGWDTATVMAKSANGVYEASDVTLLFGKLEDGKGFKFFVSEEPYPFYGQDNTEGAAFGDIKVFASENDGDSQFYPLQYEYTSGIYTIKVDLNTLKLTLTKTADVFEPSKPFYVYGEGLDKNWEMVDELKLSEIEKNIFEGHDIHIYKNSSFKFDNEDWTEYQRDDAAGEYWTVKAKVDGEDIRFIPKDSDPDFKDGKYTVRLDLNTMKVTLTLTEADPVIESQYPTTLYMSGGFNGWALEQLDMIADGKFQKENVQMNLDNGPDDPKGHGIKFFENSDWSEEWGPAGNFESENYRGWELKKYGKDAPQFYPQWMGMTSGVYTILVDFTTNTLTLTPTDSGESGSTNTYPTSIRIYGAALPWEWNNETPQCIFNGENGIIEFSTTLTLDEDWKGFKFVDNSTGSADWSKEYGQKADATADNIGFDLTSVIGGDPQFYLKPLGYESGNYTIRIDFTTMKLTLTKVN